jgi:hypothetical protein
MWRRSHLQRRRAMSWLLHFKHDDVDLCNLLVSLLHIVKSKYVSIDAIRCYHNRWLGLKMMCFFSFFPNRIILINLICKMMRIQ